MNTWFAFSKQPMINIQAAGFIPIEVPVPSFIKLVRNLPYRRYAVRVGIRYEDCNFKRIVVITFGVTDIYTAFYQPSALRF